MGWKIKFVADDPGNEKVVDLDDLSPEVFDELAKDDPDGNWWSVYAFPGAHFDRMYKVICAAAAHAGIEPPERATTMRDSERLVEMLERTPEIADQPVVDGFPQVPGEAESGSSSTSPGLPTDGLPTSPDDNPSTTS